MKTYEYFSIAIAAYLIIAGLASIFTGKVYSMGRSASKYTDESLKKFAVPYGVSNVLIGIGFLLFEFVKSELFSIGSFSVPTGLAALVVLFAIGIVIWVMGKKVLVKK